ncbi:hypothetical protein VTJ49DRAFT_4696 [Mycothermus thermophilus]|uniref:Uncharacterized protein n=1 Tax=Humicola insolens TaxID=85995 RepID=A0ABR3V629_HUMIN
MDARIVRALTKLGVPRRKRDVEAELRGLVDMATAIARVMRRRSGEDREVALSRFLAELHKRHRLGRHLPLEHFEQLFVAIAVARYRYRVDRLDAGLLSPRFGLSHTQDTHSSL